MKEEQDDCTDQLRYVLKEILAPSFALSRPVGVVGKYHAVCLQTKPITSQAQGQGGGSGTGFMGKWLSSVNFRSIYLHSSDVLP